MKFAVHPYSSKGGRSNNEDALQWKVSENSSLFVLADGLGGHRHGEVASQIASSVMIECFKKMPLFHRIGLECAVLSANNAILEKQSDPTYSSIRTTLAALYMDSNSILWAHMGDSRVYCFRDGKLLAVTKDHSVTYRKYASGLISRDEMNQDEDRSSLLHVLGKSAEVVPDLGGWDSEPQRGDAFLLCSDGFWEYVYDTEMQLDLAKSSTPQEWIEAMLLRLLERAESDCDNFSAIGIMVY